MLLFYNIGRYILLLKTIFTKPENGKLLVKRTFYEMNSIGIESLGIISMISVLWNGNDHPECIPDRFALASG